MSIEIVSFAALGGWMLFRMWLSSRGDMRRGDPVSFMLMCYSFLIVYRDWRIMFAEDSQTALIVMCVCGLLICGFSALAARAYGRGDVLG